MPTLRHRTDRISWDAECRVDLQFVQQLDAGISLGVGQSVALLVRRRADFRFEAELLVQRPVYGEAMSVFSPEVVDAVLRHMNEDHPDDNSLIVRAFAERDDATDAVMIGLDEHGGDWRYSADGREHDVRVPWSTEIGGRAEIRREVVALYDAACAKLGIEPRPH